MSILSNVGDWMARKIAGYINDEQGRHYAVEGAYYDGDHRRQLAVKMDPVTGRTTDDNVTLNFVKLAVNRSVSRLYRGGVKFVLPDGADAQGKYLENVWDLNKKEILLFQDALHGSVHGTHYMKICPNEVVDPFTGAVFPRLVALDTRLLRSCTDPQDMNEVMLYQIRYTIGQTAKYEITRRADVQYKWDNNGNAMCLPPMHTEYSADGAHEQMEAEQTWVIEEWEQSSLYGNQLTMTSQVDWPYNFPPIHHAKNLPSLHGCYGDGDIDDAINVQDRENFIVSNTGKIIKFYAHPETIGTGFSADQVKNLDAAVGSFHVISAPDAKVYNLEMNSDLASSRAFALDMRQTIFDLSREVDISSMADKLGQLTNFGLQVLWSDSIDKNDTKRQLYGDFLLELNRRLLVLANFTGEASRPGTLQWGNALPINVMEEMQADQMALELGIIDKETVAKRYQYRYGKEWDDIQEALQEEQANANANNDNVGAAILRAFNRGTGTEQPPQTMNAQQRRGAMQNQPPA